MKYLIILISTTAFFLLAFTPKTTISEGAFDKGKILFKAFNCAQCHAVGAAGMEATTKSKHLLGSDLSGYKYKSSVNVDAFRTVMHKDTNKWDEASLNWLKEFKGSDEELQAIIDWLGSLEAQE